PQRHLQRAALRLAPQRARRHLRCVGRHLLGPRFARAEPLGDPPRGARRGGRQLVVAVARKRRNLGERAPAALGERQPRHPRRPRGGGAPPPAPRAPPPRAGPPPPGGAGAPGAAAPAAPAPPRRARAAPAPARPASAAAPWPGAARAERLWAAGAAPARRPAR